MTLRRRVLLTLVPLAATVLLSGFAGLALIHLLGQRIDAILYKNYRSVVMMQDVDEASERIDSAFHFALSGREAEARALYDENWHKLDALVRAPPEPGTPAAEREALARLQVFVERYRRQGDAFWQHASGDPARAQEFFGEDGLLATFQDVQAAGAEILRSGEAHMQEASREAKATEAASLTAFGVGLLGVAVLVALAARHTVHAISAPITEVTASAEGVAAGDLEQTVRYPSLDEQRRDLFEGDGQARDELARLARAFNHMVESLRTVRQEVSDRAAELLRANADLAREVEARERIAEELLRTEGELRRAEERCGGVFRAAPDGIGYCTMEGAFVDVNDAFVRLTGHAREALTGGMSWRDVTPPERHAADADVVQRVITMDEPAVHETECLRKDGQRVPIERTAFVVHGGADAPIGLAMVSREITARKKAEARMEHLAYHDALTDLPNRALFRDRLKQALAVVRREKRLLAVHFLDLDRFKDINDTHGHAVGDALLRAVGERLRGSVRAGDTVARLGGDEFAVIQADVARVESAATLAAKLLRVVSAPLAGELHAVHVSGSIGVTVFPLDDPTGDHLVEHADRAMYLAKCEGRSAWRFFADSLDADLQEHAALLAELHQAPDHDELALYYQPRVTLAGRRVTGIDALLRWRHPRRGLLVPAQFLPLAEESGLVLPIGRWALEQACAQGRAWHTAGLPPRPVSVHVSALQLRDADLPATLDATLAATGLAPEWLEIALPEGALLSDAGERMLGTLRQRGVRLGVEGIATGCSSLRALARLGEARLEIDRAFVATLLTDPDAVTIARTLVELGHCLRMRVTAVGVETAEQADRLHAMGCDEAQGPLFGAPLPAEAFRRVLEREAESAAT